MAKSRFLSIVVLTLVGVAGRTSAWHIHASHPRGYSLGETKPSLEDSVSHAASFGMAEDGGIKSDMFKTLDESIDDKFSSYGDNDEDDVGIGDKEREEVMNDLSGFEYNKAIWHDGILREYKSDAKNSQKGYTYPFHFDYNGQTEFNRFGVGYFQYCIDQNVSFYRHFHDAVWNVTQGVAVDNTNEHACLYALGTTFTMCNCSNLNYYFVPTSLKRELNGLDLSRNFIENMDGALFRDYSEMKFLSLAYNFLYTVSMDAFQGLSQLLVLDLRGNKLHMLDGVFPVGVFKPLSSLIALRMNRQDAAVVNPNSSYPDESLSDLKSLRFLSIDGLENKTFGVKFESMKNLETLSLSGYINGHCHITSLSEKTFRYLSQLKMVNLSDCNIDGKYVDGNALQPLQNLHTLDLNWNKLLTVNKVVEIIKVLHKSNLRELLLKQVEPMFQSDTKIYSPLDQLPQNLTCLVVSANSISYLNQEVYSNLPPMLQYLDFSGNKIGFGPYIRGLMSLKYLKVFKLNGYDIIYDVPKAWPNQPISSLQGISKTDESASNYFYQDEFVKNKTFFTFPIPPDVRILTIEYANLMYVLAELHLSENNSLEELYLEDNVFPDLVGPFTGFNKLRLLVFKYCGVQHIGRNFFNNFPALEFLDLRQNMITSDSGLDNRPFRHLSNLTYLNLNRNLISYLNNDTFYGLDSLKELHLEGNRLYTFEAILSHMHQLEVLNLNLTTCHSLPAPIRHHIDSLSNITVFMANTPIDCSCINEAFLIWFTHSKAFPSYSDDYICVVSFRKHLMLSHKQLISRIKLKRRECSPNHTLFMVVLGASLLACALIVASIVYRFRFRIRFLYYGLHLWMSGSGGGLDKDDQQFEFDVFISYSNEDLNFVLRKICPQLQKRGLTTHIHSRDFRAGENVITNIIRAVKVSRKTLIVLTNNFVKSKWCRAEFQMAKEESLVTGRKCLVFLIADQIPKTKVGLEMLGHIQQNTYIPYNGEVDNREIVPGGAEEEPQISAREKRMWDKLVRDLRP